MPYSITSLHHPQIFCKAVLCPVWARALEIEPTVMAYNTYAARLLDIRSIKWIYMYRNTYAKVVLQARTQMNLVKSLTWSVSTNIDSNGCLTAIVAHVDDDRLADTLKI